MGIRVMVLVAHYLPGYKGGGPIKTVRNLIDSADSDVAFEVITGDRDLGDTEPYTNVAIGAWNQVGTSSVFYVKSGASGYYQIARIIARGSHDAVYLNSFFSLKFSFFPLLIARLFKQRVILGPRGELSDGALSIKKVKKRAYILLCGLMRLHRGVVFQASTVFEEADIRKNLGSKVSIVIAEDVGSKNFVESYAYRLGSSLRAVFVSRISPMKNLNFALEVLSEVTYPVSYHIYGPIEDREYWEHCQKTCALLPPHVEVEYRGELNPEDVTRVMSQYDVFFMPTKGENYGHVITEALSAGLPLLIADTTPWKNLRQFGVGWELPLKDMRAFSTALDELASMPPEEYDQLRKRVLSYAKKIFSQRDAIEANMAMFREVSGRDRD